MNAVAESGSWSRTRWWIVVLFVFAAHVGLIFAFTDRKGIPRRQPERVPKIELNTRRDAMLSLTDPTLFLFPHVEGISGQGWMQVSRREVRRNGPVNDEPKWLPLANDYLGRVLDQFVETNSFAHFSPSLKSSPRASTDIALVPFPTVTKAQLQIQGDLAARTLTTSPELPPLPATEVLASSAVRVLVDDAGRVITATLLHGSGAADADELALKLSREARFAPVPPEAAGSWTRGTLVFPWITIPLSATNATPAVP